MSGPNKVEMNHGSGGKQMHQLIKNVVIDKLQNGILERLDDCALIENKFLSSNIAMTTDSYVVSPLFFPGGDIGKLSICGTINDLTTSGAMPYALSLSFILEEGVNIDIIERISNSISQTAKEAQVNIVTGDTKVVEKGKGDQIYINTCGIGFTKDKIKISTHNAVCEDVVMITGPVGNHEVAMMKARKMIDFDLDIESDVAFLHYPIQKILERTKNIHVIKDPTRGGVASALWEICQHSNCEIIIDEDKIPIDKPVKAVCELTGLDPLYMANEGKFIIICPENSTGIVKDVFGPQARAIGKVQNAGTSDLLLKTSSGGIRKLGMLETIQLPRIC